MPPTRFSLAAVLRVRELAAEQEERTLTRILAELERLRRALERTETELAEAAQARERAFTGAPLPAMHLHAAYAAAEASRARAALIRKQISDFERLRVQQVARYEDAYRQREVIASLRDEHRKAAELAETKRDGKAADEAFLARNFGRARTRETK